MSELNTLKAKRLQEREAIRHNAQLKRLKVENRREYEKTRDTNSTDILRMQDRYDSEKSNMKTILEEKKRLDLELINLKKIHNDKILEIKQNNHMEVEQLRASHKNTIDNARDRFIKQKMKWQTYDD